MSRQSEGAAAEENQPEWLQDYVESPEKQKALYKRTLLIVVLSQIFGGAGLAAGITVGALLAKDMLGTESVAGLPTALFTLGSAGAALIVGRLSQRYGRRAGLASGFLTGGIGAIGVIIAAVTNNIFLLFASLLVYGAGSATNLQARYAGTDLASSKQRATAVSIAMVSTTFGAVAGPNLVEVMGEFAISVGVPALSGPFILAAAAYIVAGLVLLFFLRPDPFVVARAIALAEHKVKSSSPDYVEEELVTDKRGIGVAALIMVLTQMVMVAIMTMTPVHMGSHGHGLSAVGMVIGFHIGAMYLPSLLTGVLVDKIGRATMAVASGVTLLASGVMAAVAPGESMLWITLALILLGLGWNFGLISGTALLVDATNPTNRAKMQGTVDVMVALSGASGGMLSGMVVANSSFAFLSLAGGALSLVLIPFVIWSNKK
ncbi:MULTISPECIES: MFS transporter [unclassified Bacillus (in: firmicutes)]|uniref:MFS transporter n=1 Tax=unclassified Bacillus (in: firmicutes) TaxID=185979 RepID=UPI001BE80EED|nr:MULTISPECIES: MFS transporter [unclassified Bacillus (in: firmicutes)]MBT2636928.1 MFS transporter [Bacillus sp. ISL-39]MBT2660015.1 MFS transporter [Bacillus sp. ISL-45]